MSELTPESVRDLLSEKQRTWPEIQGIILASIFSVLCEIRDQLKEAK